MTKPTLAQVLDEVNWWQKWEIEPGVFTPGRNDVSMIIENIHLPASLNGARVLDIGGWNGAFSFECERRGASEVVMIEPTPTSSTGFERTKAYLESKVRLIPVSIYDLDPRWLGHFDIVLCLGVIYHLRYPLLGLDNIRRVCSGDLFVESAILDACTLTDNGIQPLDALGPDLKKYPLLQFFDEKQYFNDGTNWFVPNETAANSLIRSAGFDVLHSYSGTRYFSHCRVQPGTPPIFTLAHEGIDYDTHSRHLLGSPQQWAAMPDGYKGDR